MFVWLPQEKPRVQPGAGAKLFDGQCSRWFCEAVRACLPPHKMLGLGQANPCLTFQFVLIYQAVQGRVTYMCSPTRQ